MLRLDFTITLSVHYPEMLRRAALAHSDAGEASFRLPDGSVDVEACLALLLPPARLSGCIVEGYRIQALGPTDGAAGRAKAPPDPDLGHVQPEQAPDGEVFLYVDAHCLDAEFEATIRSDYGVTIKDRKRAPWAVVFQGKREELIRMYNKHWGNDNPAFALAADSNWISETYTPLV